MSPEYNPRGDDSHAQCAWEIHELQKENERLRLLVEQLKENDKRLRKVLCHVPARIAIKAYEEAGFPNYVKTQGTDNDK